jgi:hypothetical protein
VHFRKLSNKGAPVITMQCRTKKMREKNFLLPLCLMIMLALMLPATAAADEAPVMPNDTITPADSTPPAYTVTPPESPAYDPLGSLAGFFGLRQDIHAKRLANANLSEGLQDNRQEIHGNWWDNYNLFGSILQNREQVRTDQQLGLENRTENAGLRQQIHEDIANMQKDRANASVYRADINASKDELKQNREDLSLIHGDVKDTRNASQESRATVRENRQEDISLRQTNNATRQEIHQNVAGIHTDREQLRHERRNTSPGP